MKTLSIDEVRNNLDRYLSTPQIEPFVITKKGEPIAVMNLVIEHEEVERMLLADNAFYPSQTPKSIEQDQEKETEMEAFWQYIDDLYNPY